MEPNEDANRRALPPFGNVWTVTYSAEEMRPRRVRNSEETGGDGDKAKDRLPLVEGLSNITTWVIDTKTGRTYRKE